MFRAMTYFAGFATLSASAAYALVIAHETLSPDHQAVAPVVTVLVEPLTEPPVAPKAAITASTLAAPETTAAVPAQPAPDIQSDTTATLTSLRPRLRAAHSTAARTPVKTASVDPLQGIERLNPSALRADVPVMAFQNEQPTGQGQTANHTARSADAGFEREAPLRTYKPARSINPYVARSAPMTQDERLANNWNVGVYR